METLVAVAMQYNGLTLTLPQPNRHHNIFWLLHEAGLPRPINETQGFITSTGRFVDRDEGKEIAFASGQITETISKTLTSEDLW